MKLVYRGISYEAQNTLIPTICSEINAKFMGKTYKIKHPLKPVKSLACNRKYRGLAYS